MTESSVLCLQGEEMLVGICWEHQMNNSSFRFYSILLLICSFENFSVIVFGTVLHEATFLQGIYDVQASLSHTLNFSFLIPLYSHQTLLVPKTGSLLFSYHIYISHFMH